MMLRFATSVLLGQSYFLRFDSKLWAAMQPYPPLGSLYAAAFLRARGYDVSLFDSMLASNESEWTAALERVRPRMAVLFEDNFNYLSKMCLLRMRAAAMAMIRSAREHGTTVIVCGSDATDHPAEYLAAGADFVLLGEGEETLGELLDALTGRSSTPLSEIRGLASTAATTARRRDITNLDALPFPAWDLVDVERYRSVWRARHGHFSVNMVTTRGCPYHCNWCAKPIWGQRYNVRSPENVVEELVWLRGTVRPDHIWFADDIFGLQPGWLQRFADLVHRHHARTPFKSLSRADLLLREGDIDALARAGCETVWMGAESGAQKVLDAMEKGLRVEWIVEAARRLRAAKIRVGFFIQFGYPGEGRAEIEQTLDLIRVAEPDDIGVSVSYPLPGTKFYEAVRVELGRKRHWEDSNDLAMLYEGPFPTRFYRILHTIVHKEFRTRQIGRELKTLVRHPLTLRLHHVRRAASGAYHAATLPAARLRLARQERTGRFAVRRAVHAAASRDSVESKG